MERRYLKNDRSHVELRVHDGSGDGEGDKVAQVRGHAAVVDVTEEIWPGYFERILPGAFKDALGRDDVRGLFNHDSNIVLGRNVSGTLRLAEDSVGLAYEIDLPDTQLVRDMVVSPIQRGDITGSSFGFRVDRASEIPQEDGSVLRTIESLELVDVSPVTFPAYPDATVAMRGVLATKSEAEAGDLLRRILDQDLTDEEIRRLLKGEAITKPGTSKAPASTDKSDFTIALRRKGLELDRLEAQG